MGLGAETQGRGQETAILVARGQGKSSRDDLGGRTCGPDLLAELLEREADVVVDVARDVQRPASRGYNVRLRAPLAVSLHRRHDVDCSHESVLHTEVWTVQAD